MNSERMNESVDSKVGFTGRLLKAEYKRLSLEQEQARPGFSGSYPGHCLLFFMFETRVAALRRTCSHWQDVYNSNARQLIDKLSTKQAHKEEEAMLLIFLRLFLVC